MSDLISTMKDVAEVMGVGFMILLLGVFSIVVVFGFANALYEILRRKK